MGLYEQMLPTTVYSYYKIGTTPANDTTCRLCGKGMENVAHVIVECSALAQSKFLKVHISSKFLFYYLIMYLNQWTSAKEKFDLYKMQPF